MINPLFLKAGVGFLGIGTVAGAGTVGTIYKKEISDLVSSLFKKDEAIFHDYLVVAQHVETGDKSPSPDNLYKDSTKNFKCQKDEKNIDDSCEIYSLTVDATNKLLNVKKTDINKKVTGKLVKDVYYKLKVDSSKFKSIAYDGSYLIELKSNIAKEEKTFGKLKVLAKINEDSLTSDNKLIIAKVKENTITDDSIQNYQCQIGNETKHTLDCEIYKFSPVLASLSSLSFSASPTKIDKSLKADITENNYCIIDFSKDSNNSKWTHLSDENLKNTIVFAKTTDDANITKKAVFIDAKSFVGNYKDTTASNNQVFISYK